MYAYTASSFRAITSASDALPGESVGQVVPPAVLQEIAKVEAKARRNELLRQTDWTQVGDSKITGTEKAAWQTYRQALRDLPGLAGFPAVTWPTPPTLVSEADTGQKSSL
ncbi:tail fiber assembly protein [Xanthomonas sacchari]